MQVGHVRMRVIDGFVTMAMLMSARSTDRAFRQLLLLVVVSVLMVMVQIVVHVLVVMFDLVVVMWVLVIAPQHEADTDRGDHQGNHLASDHRVAETVQATTAPTNGAVANTSWPRAAPRSRAPATHSVIEAP